MRLDLKDSRTRDNLIRSFANESQARNRYDFAAEVAKRENLHVIEIAFKYTANQEKEHAKVFYDKLKVFSGQMLNVNYDYPVDNYDKTLEGLKAAYKHEYDEWEKIYKEFGQIAKEEGFDDIGLTFDRIAAIEQSHGNRFKLFADELEQGILFKKDFEVQWMCTNCGYIYEGKEAPKVCPVCNMNQGYFVLFTRSLLQE